MVEMGLDRMHHGFWKDMDPEHRKYEPGGAYESAILDYHVYLDGLLGQLLAQADDDTTVLVVSDHGAKRMDGGIRVNEWLRGEGLLATAREPRGRRSASADVAIDWSRDDRVGRRRLLRARLPQRPRPRAGGDDRARGLRARARRPQAPARGDPRRERATRSGRAPTSRRSSTREVGGVAPDLIVLFGDLLWRAVGHDRRRRGHLHLRERHRPGRREPRPGRAADHGRARESSRARARACTCSTSRRPSSSCSGSRSRPACAARACSSPSRLRSGDADRLAGRRVEPVLEPEAVKLHAEL